MTTLTRGADRLLELHAAEAPQKDELCGCFWTTLALRLHGEGPVEQDDVAVLAGSVITTHGHQHVLPFGQAGRNDFIAELPITDDDEASGTSAHGLVLAVEQISSGRLAALPVAGLDTASLLALVREASEGTAPVALVANPQTGAFWGSHPTVAQLAAYLERGDLDAGPESDWAVGHFVGLLGLDEGRAGTLIMVVDTYPAIGLGGVHLQPVERVVAALEGRGVLVIAEPDVAARVAEAGGGVAELWDNGSPVPDAAESAASGA